MRFLGPAAGFLTGAAFFPRPVGTIYRRYTGGLPPVACLLMTVGVATWLIYGF